LVLGRAIGWVVRRGVVCGTPRLLGTLFTPAPFYGPESGQLQAPPGLEFVSRSYDRSHATDDGAPGWAPGLFRLAIGVGPAGNCARADNSPGRESPARATAFNTVSRGAGVAQGVTASQYTV